MDIRLHNKKAEVRIGTLREEQKEISNIGSCYVGKNTSVSLKPVLSAVNYRAIDVLNKAKQF
jgi:hypothetical protein